MHMRKNKFTEFRMLFKSDLFDIKFSDQQISVNTMHRENEICW